MWVFCVRGLGAIVALDRYARRCEAQREARLGLAIVQGDRKLFFGAGAAGQRAQVVAVQTVGLKLFIEQALAGGAVLAQDHPAAA